MFDALLPALERINVPLPLGGTSNHFRRQALLSSGLWDPFNVTEDADLGLRLTRQGYKTAVLNSTTWEEAPSELSNWIPQRTRWFKGWMQTYAIHMRNPARLAADLGVLPFLGFQCLMAGFLLCVLLHPWFYVMVVVELLSPSPFQPWSNTDRTILLETSSLQSRCRDLNSYRYEHPGCMAPRLARLDLECLTDTILLAADFIRRLPCGFSIDKGTVSLGKDPPQGTQLEIKLFSKKRPRAEQPKSNTPYLVCFQASYRAMFSSFGG